MAVNRGFLFAVMVVLVVAGAELVGKAAAATYVVGDNLGWTVPPNGAATYTSWASRHTFRPGDVLVFNFITGQHDVAHVARGAFDGCASTNPIALATVGPANFTLNSTGPTYYICTFGQHCSLGQKLAINVTSSSPSPAPSPPPSSPPTPTPAPTPSRPAPPSPSPSPSPTPPPSQTPSPSPSPSSPGAPSPGSTPSPSPSGGVTLPPSPGSASSPGSGTPPPTGGLSPPPPPSSGPIATVSAPLVVFALVAFGLMI